MYNFIQKKKNRWLGRNKKNFKKLIIILYNKLFLEKKFVIY